MNMRILITHLQLGLKVGQISLWKTTRWVWRINPMKGPRDASQWGYKIKFRSAILTMHKLRIESINLRNAYVTWIVSKKSRLLNGFWNYFNRKTARHKIHNRMLFRSGKGPSGIRLGRFTYNRHRINLNFCSSVEMSILYNKTELVTMWFLN